MTGIRIAQGTRRTVIYGDEKSRKPIIGGISHHVHIQARDQFRSAHLLTATRQKLADTYLAGGQIKEAISLYKRVLADREHVLGSDHLDTIAARGCLGSAYYAGGRMGSALQLYEQTCAGYERVLGADHPDALTYRLSLANAYYKVGRLGDGLMLLRDIVARCEQVLLPGDPLMRAARESLINIGGG